jgi:hypothetical protein
MQAFRRSWTSRVADAAIVITCLASLFSDESFDFLALPVRAEGTSGIAKGVVIPIHREGQSEAALVVRIDRIYREYQRMGFFRIGVLPKVIAEGVKFEFRNTSDLVQSLRQARASLFEVHHASAMELRNVAFKVGKSDTPFLQARLANFDAGGL